jgi:tetratricopeptide (TPR) repeat protein
MAAYVWGLLPPSERQQHHRTAAQLYESCRDYLEAAYHWRGAGELETAVHLLLNHYSNIIASRHGEAYADLLAQFQPYEMSPELWPRLKLIAGQVAEILEDVDRALQEYQLALGAADLATKTLAYYRRAKAFQHKNIPESLAHYDYCIQLAQAVEGFPLTAVYIDRAWLYFQELRDLPQAEADLQRAETSIQPNDRRTRSDLHNAWGELYYYRQDMAQAIQHHLQGWLAANEVQDAERMMKSAHNLGLAYAEDGLYQQALDYLQRSQKLAADVGHRKMEGLTYKSIGACYFWLHQLETAIDYYGRAYDIFVEMLNHNLQAYICCDLAEAYLQIGQADEAQPFIDEGITLAQRSGNDALVRLLQSLAEQAPKYAVELNEREVGAIEFVRENGRITNQDYRDLTGVSQKQAVRDLNKLVDDGLLQRVGKGRATRYELV